MASNRKVRSLVGLLAGVLALAVFATNASAAGKYKIGVSVADQKSLFYIAAVDGMRAEAKKQGVELVVLSADNNSKQQVNQVNSLSNCYTILSNCDPVRVMWRLNEYRVARRT